MGPKDRVELQGFVALTDESPPSFGELLGSLSAHEGKLEYILWGERSKYFLNSELASFFQRAGLQEIETEIVEHSIPYPRDYEQHNLYRIAERLMEVQPSDLKAKLEGKFHLLLEEVEEYGEEFPPTLLVIGIKP